jgi:S-formylglutathione hydrolase FrmB
MAATAEIARRQFVTNVAAITVGAIACLISWPGVAPAAAPERPARIVTWGPMKSRFVDPSAAPPGSYNEPPGVEERPNALRTDVYLPAGFDRSKRYPLLLLLHGQGDAYDSWPNSENGDLLNTAAGFNGIIVMPEGDRGFYTNWWNGGQRGAPAWERYHLDELLPRVMKRLPIREGRRWHAIAGLSMGGEGTMFYASQRPGFFGSAAAFSGPLSIQRVTYQNVFDAGTGQSREQIYGGPEAQRFYWNGHDPIKLVDNLADTRLYVAAGDGVANPARPEELTNYFGQAAEAELGQQAAEFADAADQAGAPVTYKPHHGIHDWFYWRKDLADAIDWGLFRAPPRARGKWTFKTVAQTGRMWGRSFRFSDPPSELITFRRSGRQLRASGSGTVTIRRGERHFTAELPFQRRIP